ncbi:MAG TPA: hypothetical protein VKY73_10275 [Polyangiaceae bacterium]|nr:hypothetical protein [Polyangiaceae bacterium]
MGLEPSSELTDEVVREVAARVETRPTPATSDPPQGLEGQRSRHPRDNQVPFVRERWFGESFTDDLAVLRASAAH